MQCGACPRDAVRAGAPAVLPLSLPQRAEFLPRLRPRFQGGGCFSSTECAFQARASRLCRGLTSEPEFLAPAFSYASLGPAHHSFTQSAHGDAHRPPTVCLGAEFVPRVVVTDRMDLASGLSELWEARRPNRHELHDYQ